MLPIILPALDFSTIKNELFPVIAFVFTKTSSLGIKVRGLEAFVILCGGSNDPASSNDGLDGVNNPGASKKASSSSTALDKYTMQEKILPLIKGIKTKEPAVAIASLNVLRQVGGVVDADFVAMEVLPVLWSMSLGPLLDLTQFQSFMELIKSLSSRVENEQTKKLQELSGTNNSSPAKANDDFMSFGTTNAFGNGNGGSDDPEIDFERLVKGNASLSSPTSVDSGWDAQPAAATSRQGSLQSVAPSFAWSTPSPSSTTMSSSSMGGSSLSAPMRPQQAPASRTITPDLSRFDSLTPTTTQFSQPLQPQNNFSAPVMQPQLPSYNSTPLQQQPSSFQSPPASQPQTSLNWGAAAPAAPSPWASTNAPMNSLGNSMGSMGLGLGLGQPKPAPLNAFSLPPPGQQQRPGMGGSNAFSLPPPPGPGFGFGSVGGSGGSYQANPSRSPPMGGLMQQNQQKKSGLDAWESLL